MLESMRQEVTDSSVALIVRIARFLVCANLPSFVKPPITKAILREVGFGTWQSGQENPSEFLVKETCFKGVMADIFGILVLSATQLCQDVAQTRPSFRSTVQSIIHDYRQNPYLWISWNLRTFLFYKGLLSSKVVLQKKRRNESCEKKTFADFVLFVLCTEFIHGRYEFCKSRSIVSMRCKVRGFHGSANNPSSKIDRAHIPCCSDDPVSTETRIM